MQVHSCEVVASKKAPIPKAALYHRLIIFFYGLLISFAWQFSFSSPCSSQPVDTISRGVKVPAIKKEDTVTGNIYAVILGISSYPNLKPLKYADKDAELFRDFLLSPAGGNVQPDHMNILLNEKATAANFWGGSLSWLKNKQPKKGDRVYFYFAGHGDAIDKNEYFFLPYDCAPGGDKNNYLATGTIQLYNLKNRIENLTLAGVEVLLIMDACRTNELPGGADGQKNLGDAIAERRSGETMMLAASSGQESLESNSIGNGHGLFTWYLVDGLSGQADADLDNGNRDGKVDLYEIESWVKKYVKKVAWQKFQREQLPYFCCTGTSKTISKVDSAFLKQWVKETDFSADTTGSLMTMNKPFLGRTADGSSQADTRLINLYNQFNRSVKDYRLLGDSSAYYWYDVMHTAYPQHEYTNEAKYALTTELINFAQEKINLYLSGSDISLQNTKDSSSRSFQFQEKQKMVDNTPFYKTAEMLEKGIDLANHFDSSIGKMYLAKLYFLKGRSVFQESESVMEPKRGLEKNVKDALQDAYTALKIDSNAAYIYHLLAKFQFYKNWATDGKNSRWEYDDVPLDSVAYYEKKATTKAPKWSYAYYYWGNFYMDPRVQAYFDTSFTGNVGADPKIDSAELLVRKSLEINPAYVPAYRTLAKILLRKNDLAGAVYNIKRASAVDPNYQNLMSDLVVYAFKSDPDTGILYYRFFRDNYKEIYFNAALEKLSRYYIDAGNTTLSVFICNEQLAFPEPLSINCYNSPAYALSKDNRELYDTLFNVINRSPHDEVKLQMYKAIGDEYKRRKNFAAAIDWYLKADQFKNWESVTSLNIQLRFLYYQLASCYAKNKDEAKTLHYLESALEKGYDSVGSKAILADANFYFIRKTEHFQSLMQKYFPGNN